MNSRNLITLLMLLTIPMMAVAADTIWTENFAQAKATAAKEKKDLLLDFTGSDWCGWCIRLDKEVFAQPEYVKAAPKLFVHVKVDSPRKKRLSAEINAQNGKLKKIYPIRGYPTIYLIDATGRPYAKTGYMKGGPKPYLANLKKLQAKRIRRDAALAAAKKLQGLKKAEKLGEALDAIDQKLVAKFYKDVIQQIQTLDPKRQSKAAKKWTTPMVAVAADTIWTENFAKAKATAAKEKKDLLLDFTGSDWCGWCIRLDKEVFAQPEYVKAAPEMFVHVKLDFPRDKSKLTAEVKAQNKKLAEMFSIRGFPTIYLTDAKGTPYARTGYGRGGPKPYLANLKKLQAKRIRRDAALAAAEKLQGTAKAKKLGEALDAMDPKLVAQFYKDVLQQIQTLDPK